MAEETIAVIPQDDENRMIEVVRVDERYAELRSLCYGRGVGWFTQGTVRVDLESVQSLVSSLLESATPATAETPDNVISLPVGSRRRSRSRRVGRKTGT